MLPSSLKYLRGYAPSLLEQVQAMIAQGRLGAYLQDKYPRAHAVKTDKALYQHVMQLKQESMRNAALLDRVCYDSKLDVIHNALGLHTAISRVQGGKLKAKREIRVASLFRDAPAAFLDMIVVHELAHLKERDHDKAFYQLCEYMLPEYRQLEFDTRLYLTWLELPPAFEDQGALRSE